MSRMVGKGSAKVAKVIAWVWLIGGIFLGMSAVALLEAFNIDDTLKVIAMLVIIANAAVRFAMLMCIGDITSKTAELTEIFEEAMSRKAAQK